MRPRVFPAEDLSALADLRQELLASMRPRVFPAEDSPGRRTASCSATGFNEAAGIPRGRLLRDGVVVRLQGASMRPRVFPAEDQEVRAGFSAQRDASMRPRVFPAEDGRFHPICEGWPELQ